MTEISYDTFFATLSGNRRLEILQYLKTSGPKNVTDIAIGTDIEQSAVSHNLNKLLACEFVHVEVRGKQRFYSLNEETIVPLLQLVDRHIETFCIGKCHCCVTKGAANTKESARAMT
jgi:DNA-binding transcriptional ArsR family regulator